MYSVGLYTLGCKVSQYETEAVAEEFARRGFAVRPFDERNDVYVINTCTVTAESDRKSRQIIRRAIKKNANAVTVVMGCYSQRAPDEVLKIDGVSYVIGTENKMLAVDVAERMLASKKGTDVAQISVTDVTKASFEPMTVTAGQRTRVYVKIEDGCESKCTYCAISGARGRVRSKKREDVIREVEALGRSGVAEVVLTGIEVASYGRDFDEKYSFIDLLSELDERSSCERIRLGSLAPELITDEFVERAATLKTLVPHFHLSVQSGSDSVLRRMKRRYNRKMLLETVNKIRERIPHATFTTDLMVGFPGETYDDFLETVKLVREVRFLDAHVFAYSKREGTPAAAYDGQIPEDEKHRRSEHLIKVKNEVRECVLDEIVKSGEALSVIVETENDDASFTSHSDTYVEVNVRAAKVKISQGMLVWVTPVSHKDGVIYAELIEK